MNQRPVGANRRLEAVTLDLAQVKQAAHSHHGKVNDVVLALAAGGIRQLLLSRGEPVEGVCLHASVAVSTRDSGQTEAGNQTGAIVIRLPLQADPGRRLDLIARESAAAKTGQPANASNALLVWLARLGLLRFFSRHQHMVNIVETNLAGPPTHLRLLGVPLTGIVPIGTLVGNVSLGFLALSYAGKLTIAVQADADLYPDLEILLAAMHREIGELVSSLVQSGPGSAHRSA